MSETKFITVAEDEAGMRIDKLLSSRIGGMTRSHIQKLIDDGRVTVSDKAVKANYKVKYGDAISITIPEPTKIDVRPEDIPLDIVYEDRYMLVVNKPQGMVVHPAPGSYDKTLVNALLHHCGTELSGINGVLRPGILHRIDKDTSGLLLVAKCDAAHTGLAEQIKEHSLTRAYLALVHGGFSEDSGTIDLPIGRHSEEKKKMTVTYENCRNAVTHYRVLERLGKYSFIECVLETGRTHQIRVHMSHMGHPIVGDKTYGVKKEEFSLSGQLLHAYKIGFIHPIYKEYMEFSSELPPYYKKVLYILREKC